VGSIKYGRVDEMTEVDIYDTARIDNMAKVAEMMLQGHQPIEVMRETGLQRKVVLQLWEDWKKTAAASSAMQDRAVDAMNAMDAHFTMLIRRAWEAIEQVEDDLTLSGTTPQKIAQKLGAIRTVADLEAKRVDALQKSGLLDAADMGDQIAETERKQGILIDILRSDLCMDCRMKIKDKMSQVTGQVEVVVIHDR
jgi:hypothetical protein